MLVKKCYLSRENKKERLLFFNFRAIIAAEMPRRSRLRCYGVSRWVPHTDRPTCRVRGGQEKKKVKHILCSYLGNSHIESLLLAISLRRSAIPVIENQRAG